MLKQARSNTDTFTDLHYCLSLYWIRDWLLFIGHSTVVFGCLCLHTYMYARMVRIMHMEDIIYVRNYKLWVHINLCTKGWIFIYLCSLAAIMFDVTNILRIDIHILNSACTGMFDYIDCFRSVYMCLYVCVYVCVCARLYIYVCVHVYDFCMSCCESVRCIFQSYRL